ncbi:hypothetical protein T492DRAFT_981425 [Pavlovales sp. CCMP2436]|nr:hypothetical protein T492DRAFT_981425 [Pavlovales sp. CCMP2436]
MSTEPAAKRTALGFGAVPAPCSPAAVSLLSTMPTRRAVGGGAFVTGGSGVGGNEALSAPQPPPATGGQGGVGALVAPPISAGEQNMYSKWAMLLQQQLEQAYLERSRILQVAIKLQVENLHLKEALYTENSARFMQLVQVGTIAAGPLIDGAGMELPSPALNPPALPALPALSLQPLLPQPQQQQRPPQTQLQAQQVQAQLQAQRQAQQQQAQQQALQPRSVAPGAATGVRPPSFGLGLPQPEPTSMLFESAVPPVDESALTTENLQILARWFDEKSRGDESGAGISPGGLEPLGDFDALGGKQPNQQFNFDAF